MSHGAGHGGKRARHREGDGIAQDGGEQHRQDQRPDQAISDGGEEQLWYLVDLPGYGFAKVSQRSRRRWEQMIENYIRKRENLVHLFILVDSRHPPQKIDVDFINKLGEWKKSFAIVFTKADKNKPQATARNVNLFMQTLKHHWTEPPPFFISSAFTKEGRNEILDSINMI